MGVRHLDRFMRENVPGGCLRINIESEIRKYFQTAKTPNPPAPIIVIDLISLYTPLSQHDEKGVLFGGRFNLAYVAIDDFFAKLKSLGAKLEFFHDGPVQESKTETWCERQDGKYSNRLKLIEAVDAGTTVEELLSQYEIPSNVLYPLKHVAKKYGGFRLSMSRECDQELAAFATKARAFAVLSDDSDFLIYEGSWKYWSTRELELSTLFTMEFNRPALVEHLGLSFKQMPLFATLSGNHIMPYEVVRKFHITLGRSRDKFPNIGRYILDLPQKPLTEMGINSILRRVLNQGTVDKDLTERFQLSLDVYSVNIRPQVMNPTEDRVLQVLLVHDSPFMYQIWEGVPLDVSIGIVDMGRKDFGQNYARLQLFLIRRMAAIILFHRKPQRPTHCPIIIKMDHESPHQEHRVPIQYPRCLEIPSLAVMQSKEPVMVKHLRKVKFQLLSWIASDTVQHDRLRKIPQELRMTALTAYYLLEQRAIELFEADLFLQVAYDVTYDTYDYRSVVYPATIGSRPFRLIFLYQKIYALIAKAVCLVSLDGGDSVRNDPPFDGVLFHRYYDKFNDGQCDLGHIKDWRIYEDLAIDFNYSEREK